VNSDSAETSELENRVITDLKRSGMAGIASEAPSRSHSIDFRTAALMANRLGQIAIRLIKQGFVNTVFITGGETARAVMDALGARFLSLEEELMPGVSVVSVEVQGESRITMIVKPGGFGKTDLFRQVLSRFRGSIINKS